MKKKMNMEEDVSLSDIPSNTVVITKKKKNNTWMNAVDYRIMYLEYGFYKKKTY